MRRLAGDKGDSRRRKTDDAVAVECTAVSIRDEWLGDSALPFASRPDFVWLGKIRKYKRPDHVIRAMETVVKRFPEARLTIAGRHDDLVYEKRLYELVTRLRLDANVERHS